MATRSFIANETTNGVYDAVYCHWDGYPEGVGATLREHYTTSEDISTLLDKGDMSSLGETLEKTEFYTARGEKLKVRRNLSLTDVRSSARNAGCEYLYVFSNGAWQHYSV